MYFKQTKVFIYTETNCLAKNSSISKTSILLQVLLAASRRVSLQDGHAEVIIFLEKYI